jgi:ABC-type polysaccharide/polyol phosphate export permease
MAAVAGELAKLPAFGRRDLLEAWSYRAVFFSDLGGLAVELVTFYLVGLMINPSVLPEFGGKSPSYVEFVAVGIALNVFLTVGFARVAGAIRQEQYKGTLESLLMTPTALATIQLGSVVYDLLYIPLRTVVFLLAVWLVFGVGIDVAGLAPVCAIMLVFIPFAWGLGLVSAASALTFRGAGLGFGILTTVMTLSSGAYFPLDLLPHWLTTLAEANPLAIVIDGGREALLGGAGWSEVPRKIAILAPTSAVSLSLGILAFRAALARERRRGTLSLY